MRAQVMRTKAAERAARSRLEEVRSAADRGAVGPGQAAREEATARATLEKLDALAARRSAIIRRIEAQLFRTEERG